MKKSILKKLALPVLVATLFFSCANGSNDDSGGSSGGSGGSGSGSGDDGYLTVDGDNVYLQKLNCLSTYSYSSGNFTSFGDQLTAPSSLGGSWLIWGEPITKTDSITMTAWVTFSDSSKQNGIGFLSQNGSYCTAYSAGMQVGVKNVNVDNCTDFSSDKGNGYSYQGGISDYSGLIGSEVMEKVSLDNQSMVFSFYTTTGTLLATKTIAWDAHWTDDAKLYLGIGGFATSSMTISKVKITSLSGDSYVANKVAELAVSSLTVSSISTRVAVSGSTEITATATTTSGKAASVTVGSSSDSIATASVVNSEGTGTITINGIASGTATITVTNASDTTLTKAITVYVDNYASSDSYSLGTDTTYVYPAAGSTDAPVDGWFRMTFTTAPTLDDSGCINIYKASDNTVVDTIQFSGETINAWSGVNLDVDKQMAYVSGNNVYFMLHNGVLENGTEYYVAMPTGAISGTFAGADFATYGLTPTSKTWSFTTRSAPDITDLSISVDCAEGSTSDYRSIEGALLGIGTATTGDYTLNVAAGDYKELVYWKGKASATIKGAVASGTYGSDVVIHWFNGEKMNSGTHTRPSFYWGSGTNLTLENVTIKNDYDRAVYSGDAQAEAIYFANGNDTSTGLATAKLAAYNCTFLSHQDTIQTTGKAWFYKCYIEGDVDFLWGTAQTALFDTCKLVSVLDSNRGTASTQHLIVARTGVTGATTIGKGFVVLGSEVEIESGVTMYFGRDAGTGNFYDQAAIVDSTIDGSGTLNPALWDTSAYLYLDGYAADVGWKVYNITSDGSTAISTSSKAANTNDISSATYTAEYSTRDLILNRVYNMSTHAYQADSTVWDLTSLKTEFGITD